MSLPLSLISASRPEVLIQRMQPVAWYDHADTATLFQDAAGTTPTTLNLPIGLRRDKSGRGNHAVQATAAARPVLNARRNAVISDTALATAGVIGAGGALPSGWTIGAVPGITREVVGKGTLPDGTAYFDVRVYGTNTSGSIGGIPIRLASYGVVPAALGDTVTTAVKLQLVAGSANGFSAFDITIIEFSATGVWLVNTPAPPGWNVPTLTKQTQTRTCTHADTRSVTTQITFTVPAGNTVDATIRIAEPQLEYGPTATRYQRVTTATDYDAQGFPLKCDFDTVDDALVTTFAAPLGGSCTVARAIPGVGAQILTGQTIGTTFSDTTDSHGLLIFDRALTAPETAAVTRWCAGRAGL